MTVLTKEVKSLVRVHGSEIGCCLAEIERENLLILCSDVKQWIRAVLCTPTTFTFTAAFRRKSYSMPILHNYFNAF